MDGLFPIPQDEEGLRAEKGGGGLSTASSRVQSHGDVRSTEDAANKSLAVAESSPAPASHQPTTSQMWA